MASTFQNGLKKVSFFIKGIIFPYQTSKIPPRANPVSLLENFPDSPAWQNSIFRAKTRIREQFFFAKTLSPKILHRCHHFYPCKNFFFRPKKKYYFEKRRGRVIDIQNPWKKWGGSLLINRA